MYGKRVVLRIALTAMVTAVGIDIAEAASSVCNGLEARLASLQRGGGYAKAAAFAGAANQQQAEISATEAQARRAGCYGGFLIFQARPAPQCASIMKNLTRMRTNLARLQNQRQNFSSDAGSTNQQRSSILQQLGANGCGPQYTSYANQRRGFFERLFNPDPAPSSGLTVARIDPGGLREVSTPSRGGGGGNSGGYDTGFGGGSYRTLCVRTCDGFYFPIEYSARRSSFATDEQICRQMCPGTDVALYAHRNPGQDSSQAISTTGETRYSDLPTAFAYRTKYNASCTCGKSLAGDAVAGGYTPVAVVPASGDLPPVPSSSPSPGEDPETIANREGQLDPGEVGKPNVASPVASLSLPAGGAVRRVGPSYYYAQ